MTIPRASSHKTQLAAAVADVERQLVPDVVSIRFTLGEDWAGDPAVFFMVVLPDAVATKARILAATNKISETIERSIEPLEQWGVLPYFRYRSQSEQAQLNEPAWA